MLDELTSAAWELAPVSREQLPAAGPGLASLGLLLGRGIWPLLVA